VAVGWPLLVAWYALARQSVVGWGVSGGGGVGVRGEGGLLLLLYKQRPCPLRLLLLYKQRPCPLRLAFLVLGFLVLSSQGAPPQFPGVLVGRWTIGPPHVRNKSVRKCHQMSSKEHIQLGWVVRWVLSTPPGRTPRLGGVYVPCQYFPCSFVLALRELGLRLGQSPTPAPHQLPWSPPRDWRSRRLAHSTFERLAH
jgi:hypothetical protein